MLKNRKVRGLVALSATGVCAFFQFCALSRAQTRDDISRQMLAPLIQSGIPVDEPSALIRTLHDRNSALAMRAAYALSRLQPSKEAVVALTAVIRDAPPPVSSNEESSWEFVAVYAARTLAVFGERNWIPVARVRLTKLSDLSAQVQLSATLASLGCYDGWLYVREGLLSRYDYEALIAARSFMGMTKPDGSAVDIATEIEQLAPSVREVNRKLALSIAAEIRAKQKPR